MRFSQSLLSIAVFAILSSAIHADELKASEQDVVKMHPIIVEAKKSDDVGTTYYNQEQLQNAPNGKKSISDFLRTHTNVQFERDSNSAGSQASLAPEKISINGASTFDNKFLINGVNTSNTFDPVGESADSNYYGTPSNSQTANINTDLLCELEVIDSNASAEHGEFQGGVIAARTCAPKTEIGKLHGTISYDYTNSAWSRFNYINTEEEDQFQDQDTSHPKEYTTQGTTTNIYGRLNNEWSFNAFVANRNSRIPVMSGFGEENKVKTEENNNNLGITAFFNPNEQQSYKFGIEHYKYKKEGYYKNIINSDYNIDTITNTFFINTENKFNGFKLEQNLNYRTTELDRHLKQNSSTIWSYSKGSKDWRPNLSDGDTLTEGGFGGNLINMQSTLSYDIKTILDPIKLVQTIHLFKVGAGYQHNEGSWERPDAMSLYTTRANLGIAQCATGDLNCDETDLLYRPNSTRPFEKWTGQYSRLGTYYSAGKFKARQDQWHIFAEDDISWNNFRARLGLRADYDSLASNFNIAPRSVFEYKPFSNDILRLTAGFNRYYGNTFLITELDEKAYTTYANLSRSTTYQSSWNAENDYGWIKTFPNTPSAAVRATDVKTPYSDEKVFAINSQIKNVDLGIKWVNRDFNDRLQETRIFKTITSGTSVLDYRTYSNVDGGHANTYSFSILQLTPYEFMATQHKFNLGLSYIDNKTTRGSYKDSDSDSRNEFISLDGKIIPKSQLPIKDSPFTARLNWEIKGTQLPLSIYNFLNFRSASKNYVKTNDNVLWNGEEIAVMEEKDFSSKFTWDTRATYDWQLGTAQTLTFGLTVSNLLNKKNVAVSDGGSEYSEEGRRFIADLTFKF